MGPYIGYLVGCCESAEYILYVASSIIPLGKLISYIFDIDSNYEPFYWVFFYLATLSIQILGGNFFWKFNFFITFVTCLFIALFLLLAPIHANFELNAKPYGRNNFDVQLFLEYLPLASWFFVGIEALPLACSEVHTVTNTYIS
jgi:hypothetical protein